MPASGMTADFPLLMGLETALLCAAGLPLIGALEGLTFPGGDAALSMSMVASRIGATN